MEQRAEISESDILTTAVGGLDQQQNRGGVGVLPTRPLPVTFPEFDTWQVLLVESEQQRRAPLSQALGRHVHQVSCVDTGAEALEVYDQADVVLLGPDLPDIDGLEVCRAIRATCDIPIIVITDRTSELDCVLALQAGADDYVAKPYGFRELMARMDAVMRRATPRRQGEHVIEHGRLRIDTLTREVQLHNRMIPMSRKEFDLLHLLAVNPDSVVSREHIMRQIWENSWSRRTVDTHVSSIRQKLGGKSWILTVRGIGFRIGRDVAMS
ncbi:response regulator transcription factor [Streptomyces sp. H51]|uniref:response regulator transcription factor n=1 Tax=Streptomyces sp. H51 TaxID=3111770 RepID=UPI002D7A0C83|nr:response regulator transcription factor [Streptomyces sp. H51]